MVYKFLAQIEPWTNAIGGQRVNKRLTFLIKVMFTEQKHRWEPKFLSFRAVFFFKHWQIFGVSIRGKPASAIVSIGSFGEIINRALLLQKLVLTLLCVHHTYVLLIVQFLSYSIFGMQSIFNYHDCAPATLLCSCGGTHIRN